MNLCSVQNEEVKLEQDDSEVHLGSIRDTKVFEKHKTESSDYSNKMREFLLIRIEWESDIIEHQVEEMNASDKMSQREYRKFQIFI